MSPKTFTDSEKTDGFRWSYFSMTGYAMEFWSCVFGKIAPVTEMKTFSSQDLGGEGVTIGDVDGSLRREGYRAANVVELINYVNETKWSGPGDLHAIGSSRTHESGTSYPVVKAGDGWRDLNTTLMGPQARLNEDDVFLAVREP